MNYTIFDGLALSDLHFEPDHPKPFRLFAVGENPLTRNGAPCVLHLTAEEIQSIADYQHSKGEKIPIDSRHALFLAAEKAGVSESEAVKAVNSKVAALGFAALEARPDGLYAVDVELLPLAAELFKQGSLRYWSPVIRGLDRKTPLRITSIAFDNVPALNGLDVLAASDNSVSDKSDLSDLSDKNRKENCMTETEKALRALLGNDALVLSDTTDAETAAAIAALGAELQQLRSDKAALELAAENAQKTALIDKAIAENRATNGEREGLMQLDLAWLSAELPKRPAAAVPVTEVPVPEKKPKVTLTPEEKEFALSQGLTEEEYLKSKENI